MTQNIDAFNAGVALIMGKLYENFPKMIRLESTSILRITREAITFRIAYDVAHGD